MMAEPGAASHPAAAPKGNVVPLPGTPRRHFSTAPIPAFATLTLEVVPEPGALLTLGSDLALLAAPGRSMKRA